MKLLVFQPTSIFEQYGGIEYYLDDFLTLGADLWGNGNVECLVPERKDLHFPSRPYAIHTVPLRHEGLWAKFQNRYSAAFFRQAIERARAFQPDFLICGHVSLGPLTCLVSKLTRIPYISVVYGVECWSGLFPQDEWALRHAHALISISQWTKNVLVRRGFPPDRIRIVHPCLDATYEGLPYPGKQVKPGSFKMLSVSRLDARERYKGQDHVLEAMARLKKSVPVLDIQYTIQGEGTDRHRLEELTQQLNLGDRVQFVGSVADRTGLEPLYRQADLFAMPSQGEGFGIVYVEAASFAVPSLAYDCGGVKDIVTNGVSGILVPPADISALTTAIETLATHPEKALQLGRAAFEGRLKFSRTAIGQELLAAFAAKHGILL